MRFSLYIATRYLFTKTSNNAINIITLIATFGVIVGSLALFIILSGFSGLRTFSYALLDASDPDIKIIPTVGKKLTVNESLLFKLQQNSNIADYSRVIEERVFLEFNEKNEIAYIKGVEENYNTITQIDSAMYVGTWLDFNYTNAAVIGRNIANKLSLGMGGYGNPLKVMVPKPGVGFINPINAFNQINVQMIGLYSGTEEFESKYVYVTLAQAKELLGFSENEVSALEIKLINNANPDAVVQQLENNLSNTVTIKTRAQLNEVFYKVINTENFVSYLIFTLIIVIALFNVIGAIIMMIIEKKENLKTLYNIGASLKEIKSIFMYQGFLLTFLGMLAGLLLGIILVILQQRYQLFMITESFAYPVEFKWINLLIVVVTISVLGFIAAKIASSRINQQFLNA